MRREPRLRAGLNMEMVSQTYHDHLAELVEAGEVPKSTVDDLVLGVLRVKLELGLFENPYVDMSRPSPLLAKDHLQLAHDFAKQSMVLLKNENGVLPLNNSKLKKLAVIGPLPTRRPNNSEHGCPMAKKRIVARLWRRFGKRPDGTVEVLFAAGLKDDFDRSTDGFAEAVAAAREADEVLLFVGERASLSARRARAPYSTYRERQTQLVEAVALWESQLC